MSSSPRSPWWRWIINIRTHAVSRLSLATLAALAAIGCRQDMHNQPKFDYQQRSTSFYADGRSARPQVSATLARSQLHQDSYLNTGFIDGKEGDGMPFPVNATVLARGQQSYNVYCTPCHSRVGNGAGMIVQRGYAAAGNFHTARLLNAPLGHFYNVIANGYGAMPDYSAQLTPENRWAVVAYIKALQLSQRASEADVAKGEHVESLENITEHEGLPAGFAYDWNLPTTAVKGTPNGDDYVIPTGTNNPLANSGGHNHDSSQANGIITSSTGNTPFPENDATSTAGAMNEQK